MKTIAVAYVPVLHRGYIEFFHDVSVKTDTLFVIGSDIIHGFPSLRKDIRALDPKIAVRVIQSLDIFTHVETLTVDRVGALSVGVGRVIFPADATSELVAGVLFTDAEHVFVPVFLRWDRASVLAKQEVEADVVMAPDAFMRIMFASAEEALQKSSDWWRRVGAVLVADSGERIIGHNEHVPSPHAPYFNGDPRSEFSQGEHIELSTADHAEAVVIATAAARGIRTTGAKLFVTTFPCPPCARLIARSGVRELYFLGGYGMLDGLAVVRDAGVKVIRVTGIDIDSGGRAIPYPIVR